MHLPVDLLHGLDPSGHLIELCQVRGVDPVHQQYDEEHQKNSYEGQSAVCKYLPGCLLGDVYISVKASEKVPHFVQTDENKTEGHEDHGSEYQSADVALL